MSIIHIVTGFILSVICNILINKILGNIAKIEESEIEEKRGFLNGIKEAIHKVKHIKIKFNIIDLYNDTIKSFNSKMGLMNIVIMLCMFSFLSFHSGWIFIVEAVIISCFDIMAITDFCTFFIAEELIYVLVGTVIILGIFSATSVSLKTALISMVVYGAIFGFFCFITKGKFAFGDVEMITIMSGLLGWFYAVYAVIFAMVLNILVYIIMSLIFKKRIAEIGVKNNETEKNYFAEDVLIEEHIGGLTVIDGKVAMALGPFLAISTIIFYFYGFQLLTII